MTTSTLDQLRHIRDQLAAVPLSAWVDEHRQAAEQRCTIEGCEHNLCVLDDPDYPAALNVHELGDEAQAALAKLIRAIEEAS